jgi:hypothetical protein
MRAGGMLLCALLALASCGAVSSFIATPLNGAPVRATGRAPALSLRMADPHVARRDVPALLGRALLTGAAVPAVLGSFPAASNAAGELGSPEAPIVVIGSGEPHPCGPKKGGILWCWPSALAASPPHFPVSCGGGIQPSYFMVGFKHACVSVGPGSGQDGQGVREEAGSCWIHGARHHSRRKQPREARRVRQQRAAHLRRGRDQARVPWPCAQRRWRRHLHLERQQAGKRSPPPGGTAPSH